MVKEIVCLDKNHVSSLLGESLLRIKVGIVSMAVNAPWVCSAPWQDVVNLKWSRSACALNGDHSGFGSNLHNDSTLSLRCQAMKEHTLSLWFNEYLGQLVTLWFDQCVKLEPQKTFPVFSVLLQLLLARPIDSVIVWCPYLQTGQFPSARLFDLWGLTLYWFTWR